MMGMARFYFELADSLGLLQLTTDNRQLTFPESLPTSERLPFSATCTDFIEGEDLSIGPRGFLYVESRL